MRYALVYPDGGCEASLNVERRHNSNGGSWLIRVGWRAEDEANFLSRVIGNHGSKTDR